jgi:TPR repeat protein
MGGCYEHGVGVKKDLDRALELYTRSADKGYRKAKEALDRLKGGDGGGKPKRRRWLK